MIKLTLIGDLKAAQRLAQIGPALLPALAQALTEEAQLAFRDSQKMVPRKTGALAASGSVNRAVMDGKGVSVEFGYGGAASAYALIVHEDLNARHRSGTAAKYLEVPVRRRIPQMEANITARIARIVSGK